MVVKVTAARCVSGYSIWLSFSTGAEGIVDLSNELFGEMFEPLRDIEVFKSFSLNKDFGTITWSNGADFAPEFLLDNLRSAA